MKGRRQGEESAFRRYSGREMPSICIFLNSVERFIPRRAAAPFRPPTTQPVFRGGRPGYAPVRRRPRRPQRPAPRSAWPAAADRRGNLQQWTRGYDDRPLDDVLQLAEVAWPGVARPFSMNTSNRTFQRIK
jgi:hypothetical protein